MKESYRMVTGYIAGGVLVIVLFPSIIYLVTFLADSIFRIELFQNRIFQWIVVSVLLATGLLFGISSIIYQNIKGEGGPLELMDIEISPKTKKLVVSGPYRFTRNPMLFGTILIYLAIALIINSLTAVIVVVLFALFMLTAVVRKEEERLLRDFGSQYELYRRNTSLFIPWFPEKSNKVN